MKVRLTTLLLLSLALLLLTACASSPATQVAGPSTTTPTTEYRMAVVKTRTPTPDAAATQTAKPTATWVAVPSPGPTSDKPTKSDVPRVSVEQAKAKADAGEAVLVDVRSQAAYEQLRVAGAISLPANEIAKRHAELPSDKLLVFY